MNYKIFFALLAFANLTTCMSFDMDRHIIGFRVYRHFLETDHTVSLFYKDGVGKLQTIKVPLTRVSEANGLYLLGFPVNLNPSSKTEYLLIGEQQELTFRDPNNPKNVITIPPKGNNALGRTERGIFKWGVQPEPEGWCVVS